MRRYAIGLLLLLALPLPVSALFQPPNETFSFSAVKDLGTKTVTMLYRQSSGSYFAVTSSPSELYSSTTGDTWTKLSAALPVDSIYAITANPSGHLFISGSNFTVSSDGVVYKSTDGGATWSTVGSSIPNAPQLRVRSVPYYLFAWHPTAGLYYLNGTDWSRISLGDAQPLDVPNVSVSLSMFANKNSLTTFYSLSGYPRIYVTEKDGLPITDRSEWYGSGRPKYVTYYDSYYYVIAQKVVGYGYGGSLYKSSDGKNWKQVYELSGEFFNSIDSQQSQGIYAVTNKGKIIRSWDGGNWTIVTTPAGSASDIIVTAPHTAIAGLDTKIWKVTSNAWPTASASYTVNGQLGGTAKIGDQIQLLAIGTDAEGDGPLSFSWTQSSGPTVGLSGSQTSAATFSPQQNGTYLFKVKIQDSWPGEENSTATLNITVGTVPPPNRPPVVSAGPDKICIVNQTCVLQGTATDPDGDSLSIGWGWPSPIPFTVISGINTLNMTIQMHEAGNYTFQLGANDGTSSARDTVIAIGVVNGSAAASQIALQTTTTTTPQQVNATSNTTGTTTGNATTTTIPSEVTTTTIAAEATTTTVSTTIPAALHSNNPPVIDVTPVVEAAVGDAITLRSIGVDPEGKPLRYSWEQIGGTLQSLSGNTEQNPTFTASEHGTYVFSVHATDDNEAMSLSKIVLVTVREAAPSSQPRAPEAAAGTEKETAVAIPTTLLFGGVAAVAVLAGFAGMRLLKKKPGRKKAA